MIIALISDVHGNLPALKAVLKDAAAAKAERIWCMGDSVGYVPFPNECISLVRKRASASVVGNYDRKVIEFEQNREEWKQSKRQAKFDAFEWNARRLDAENRSYLQSLPQNMRLEIDGYRVFLTHGSPEDIDEPVWPQTSEKRLIELGKIADADIVVMGHSHQFMDRTAGGKRFINPGAVGIPSRGDLRASYALLEISRDGIKAAQHKVKYDISKAVKKLRQADQSDRLIKMVELEYGFTLEDHPKPAARSVRASVPSHQRILKAARQFAKECNYEEGHSEHVTTLALSLFDELKPLHKLKADDRFLLNCAGVLHDIGWIEGQKGHHKTAMRLILNSEALPFSDDQRRMVALIVRYHRKALPRSTHPVYSKLSGKDKRRTRILAGLLRVADGLDRTHGCLVRAVKCDFTDKDIIIRCKTSGQASEEFGAAIAKSSLLEQILKRTVRFTDMQAKQNSNKTLT